jgi:hypothetical protein
MAETSKLGVAQENRAHKLAGAIGDAKTMLDDLDQAMPPGIERESRRQSIYGLILDLGDSLGKVADYQPNDDDVH